MSLVSLPAPKKDTDVNCIVVIKAMVQWHQIFILPFLNIDSSHHVPIAQKTLSIFQRASGGDTNRIMCLLEMNKEIDPISTEILVKKCTFAL